LQNITIRQELEQDLPPVSGNFQLLQQVIFDLITNAKWAIEKKSGKRGGDITINTKYDPASRQISILVTDTGIGITQENLTHIFEPFFTTKAIGEGTGLGLSIIYGIIKEHRGQISVESIAGQGAAFKILLPIAKP
jgi:two-component system, NtrC family, sensor kinase